MKSSITFFIYFLFNFHSFGQTFGNDETFNPNDTSLYFSESKYLRIALQTDGKAIVAETYPNERIVRWNQDAHVDHTFSTKSWLNDSTKINDILALPDGKLLVAGYFTNNKGSLIKLLSDGKIDNTFNVVLPNLTHKKILLQPDGKIILLGSYGVIRLNPDGHTDNTFNSNNGVGFINTYPTKMALQPNGKILVVGATYNGIYKSLIRLNSDGSVDNTLDITHTSGTSAIIVQSDGKILVGKFTGNLIRLNPDGSLDNTFNPDTSLLYEIFSINCQSDGKIVVGSRDYNSKGILRFNPDGTTDNNFNNSSVKFRVEETIMGLNGDILALGSGISTYRKGVQICKIKNNGNLESILEVGTGFNYHIQTMVLQPDGKILVGGFFDTYYNTQISSNGRFINRLYKDGTIDTTFNTGIGFNNSFNVVNIQSDGKIVVGGGFTSYKGIPCQGLIRINPDGNLDTTFKVSIKLISGFNDIIFRSDRKILVANCNNIFLLTSNGDIDETFSSGTGFNGCINKILLQSDGKVLAIGDWRTYQGEECTNNIVRLNPDGSLDRTFNANITFGERSFIKTITLQPDGKILLGGYFTYRETAYPTMQFHKIQLVRLNMDGSIDENFNLDSTISGFPGQIKDIIVQIDGKILVGGLYNQRKDYPSIYYLDKGLIVRLQPNGEIDRTFGTGIGFNGSIETMKLQLDGKIVVGGIFTSYNNTIVRNKIARLNPYSSDGILLAIGNQNHQSILSIYPNPTSDYLNLMVNPNSIWQITDTFGKVLMAGKIQNSNAQIDIRSLTQGIYILHLTDPQGNKATKRIVKQ